MVGRRQHLGGGLAQVGLVLRHHVPVPQLGLPHVGDVVEGAGGREGGREGGKEGGREGGRGGGREGGREGRREGGRV